MNEVPSLSVFQKGANGLHIGNDVCDRVLSRQILWDVAL